jgi:hypothetical protein
MADNSHHADQADDGDPEEAKPQPPSEAILADERQTERQAPNSASPGEAAGG